MTKQWSLTLFVAFLTIFQFSDASAQGMLDPVSFEIVDSPQKVRIGETIQLDVRAKIEGKWHLYSINNDPDAGPFPTEFTSKTSGFRISGDITETKPTIEMDPNFNARLGFHTKSALFTIPITVNSNAQEEGKLALEVYYQVCDDKSCLPPKSKTIEQTFSVTGEKGQSSSSTEIQNGKENIYQQPPSSKAGTEQGVLTLLWIAILAGYAALLTPCVFPMIPLTVSYFSKQNSNSGWKAFRSAIFFGIAIVITFTILGILLAIFIGASGANQFAANPWVNLFIGLVLVLFAISLLGAFEIRLPYQLTNWLNNKSNTSGGVLGTLFMSLTISAVSFSCTAPFVGGVLAAAAGGEWFYPIIGMVGFSAAFASPFVLFALFPDLLESLPKSGGWMNIVKVLLGFIELAAAVKFFSNADLVWGLDILSRPFAIAIWISIFLLSGLYLLGTFVLKHDKEVQSVGTGRLMLSVPFFLFSFYLLPGLLGASLGIWDAWLPPKQATDVSVVYSIAQANAHSNTNESINDFTSWSEDYQKSLVAAQNEGEPVFIDFTGYTCTNCRAMETNVFPLKEVQEKFSQMELVRLYTDDGVDGPQNQKFQFEMTGTIALPTYVIVNSSTGVVINQLSGYADEEEFKQFLEKGLQEFSESQL